MELSTEELLQKLQERGINVTEEEAQRFRDNEVDGETIECGLTDNMIAFLFSGSFKKQAKFNKFVKELKDDVVTLTLQPVPEEFYVQPLAEERYPTNAEYVQVVKALIMKYPFLMDMEGNGYDTWHQSLKRKFKAERAPLIHNDEVKRSKEKFGNRGSRGSTETAGTCPRPVSEQVPAVIGEDATSIERHVHDLHMQYEKIQPDNSVVKDRMQRTFVWRRKEITDGMKVEDVLRKYPFLGTPSGLWEEVDRIHPSAVNLCHRLKEGFTCIVPKVIKLVEGKSTLAKIYSELREELLAEQLPEVDFRAALVMLPLIFKEKVDHFISVGQRVSWSPYPTVQLGDSDWKMASARKVPISVRVDGVDLCQGTGVEEGVIAAFCAYFVFNLAYPPYLKKTLTFLQRTILNITEVGDKALPVTITRTINLLF
ncbi:uncharacterized protein LOC114433895 isoform X4 [Parambassis ranga]|uniref:Uncharacterized protein LOC114433894 isoform X4 n=1 Tax=Parambassis ranga TaxID=210632 RepID=A0A6P7I1N3_9TELE|nr:uncharacterized protein LOC114433894 isoform X4 [Parambassis ranga]XP_028258481.1 uncharacterized protein LOC114433895 isoform X4 [Parambassis ranga]